MYVAFSTNPRRVFLFVVLVELTFSLSYLFDELSLCQVSPTRSVCCKSFFLVSFITSRFNHSLTFRALILKIRAIWRLLLNPVTFYCVHLVSQAFARSCLCVLVSGISNRTMLLSPKPHVTSPFQTRIFGQWQYLISAIFAISFFVSHFREEGDSRYFTYTRQLTLTMRYFTNLPVSPRRTYRVCSINFIFWPYAAYLHTVNLRLCLI